MKSMYIMLSEQMLQYDRLKAVAGLSQYVVATNICIFDIHSLKRPAKKISIMKILNITFEEEKDMVMKLVKYMILSKEALNELCPMILGIDPHEMSIHGCFCADDDLDEDELLDQIIAQKTQQVGS